MALTPGNPDIYLDTNLDGNISPIDALGVINALNAAIPAARGASPTVISTAVAAAPGSATIGSGAAPGSAATGSGAGPAIATAGGTPTAGGTSAAAILATDAVFAGLAPSSEPATAANLQSKGSAWSLGGSTVRKSCNMPGSNGADAG